MQKHDINLLMKDLVTYVPNAAGYCFALKSRIKIANYYFELAQEIALPVFVPQEGASMLDDCEEGATQDYVEAHIISALHCLHACRDYLGQVINLTVLPLMDSSLTEREVNYDLITKKLKSNTSTYNILKVYQAFNESREFAYVNAFVNTIKHRQLLTKRFNSNIDVEKNLFRQGISFDEFTYKEVTYPIVNLYHFHTATIDIIKRDVEVVLVEILEFLKSNTKT